jgi:hypothetical protein
MKKYKDYKGNIYETMFWDGKNETRDQIDAWLKPVAEVSRLENGALYFRWKSSDGEQQESLVFPRYYILKESDTNFLVRPDRVFPNYSFELVE